MVSNFIDEIIRKHRCVCGEPILEQSVFGVGVCTGKLRRTGPDEPQDMAPALVVYSCRKCGYLRSLRTWVPFGHLMQTIEEEFENGIQRCASPAQAAEPMVPLPGWIVEAYKNFGCSCGAPYSADSVEGVSMNVGDPKVYPNQVDFFVMLRCPICGFRMMLPGNVMLNEFLAGARTLHQYLESRQPPPESSPKMPAEPEYPFDQPPERSESETVRPSLPPFHPIDLPSEQELRTFLNCLKRTSFKVGTKSLRRFLKQLGIDVDALREDDADEQSEE